MVFGEVGVLGLSTKLQPHGNRIFKQVFCRDVEVAGLAQPGRVKRFEPGTEATRQRRTVKRRAFVELVDGERPTTPARPTRTSFRRRCPYSEG